MEFKNLNKKIEMNLGDNDIVFLVTIIVVRALKESIDEYATSISSEGLLKYQENKLEGKLEKIKEVAFKKTADIEFFKTTIMNNKDVLKIEESEFSELPEDRIIDLLGIVLYLSLINKENELKEKTDGKIKQEELTELAKDIFKEFVEVFGIVYKTILSGKPKDKEDK